MYRTGDLVRLLPSSAVEFVGRADAQINAALALKPGDPLLEELLINSYQDELAVLASVQQLTAGNGSGTLIDATRMQL